VLFDANKGKNPNGFSANSHFGVFEGLMISSPTPVISNQAPLVFSYSFAVLMKSDQFLSNN
jgi:hypothetical protein